MAHLIKISRYPQQMIDTEEKYLRWLSAVSNEQEVIVQRFHPSSNSCLGLKMTYWRFENYRVRLPWGILDNGKETTSFDLKTGYVRGADSEVFPDRVIPMHPHLLMQSEIFDKKPPLGRVVISDRPVYEPFWFGALYLEYLVEYGPEIYRHKRVITEAFPRHYVSEFAQGHVYHCFSQDYDPPVLEYDLKPQRTMHLSKD